MLIAARPFEWTGSGRGFDRAQRVLILELYGAQIAPNWISVSASLAATICVT